MSSLPRRTRDDLFPLTQPSSPAADEPAPGRSAPTLQPPRPAALALLTDAPAFQPGARLWRTVHFQEVFHVRSEKELLALLEERAVDLVVLDPGYGRGRFLDGLKRLRPAVRLLFLVEEPRPPRLLKLRARGHHFASLPCQATPRRLARGLLELLFPRAEPRRAVSGLRVVFGGRSFELENVSCHGIAWRVSVEELDEALVPGRVVRALEVHQGDQLIFTAAHARIRHLSAVAGGGRFRVGARLLPAAEDPATVVEERLFDDPITVSSLLKQALERAEFRFTDAHDGALLFPGRWDARRDPFNGAHPFLGEWPERWQPGGVVRCCFELNNWGCEYFAAIEARPDTATLALRPPAVVKGVRRREIPRHRPSAEANLRVRFQLPFAERWVECRPRDFTVRGFAFELPESRGPVLPGTRLPAIAVVGLDAPFAFCAGVVCHVRPVQLHGRRHLHCGVQLDDLGEARGLIAVDALVNDRLRDVKSGQGMHLDDLWAFFYASNFIYPKKEEAMRPIIDQVKANYGTLLRERGSPLMRTVVVNSPEVVVEAHMSLLHAYSETWIMQHLASVGMQTQNPNAVRDAYLGTVNMLNQLDGVRWMRAYFQPSKSFPDRIAGVFARRVEDRNRSILNRYAYLNSPTSRGDEADIGLSIRPAEEPDLQMLQGHLAARGSLAEFLAEDGAPEERGLESIQRLYARHRLRRERRFVVAEVNGTVLGGASLEFSSFGLNLSEVTNRCTIHAWQWEPHTVTALAEYARLAYRREGFPFCVVMVDPEHAEVLTTRGFNYTRDYACWTLHRDIFPDYVDYIEKAFTTRV
ncbi:hypothetical protein [Endothiovibrio diazotrophicus]